MADMTSLLAIPATPSLEELISLKGRVAIVTGGSRGIGKEVVRRLSQAGCQVAFTARHEDVVRATEAEIRDEGGDVVGIVADVCNLDDSRKLVSDTVQRFGHLDILVNNAATFPPGSAMEIDEDTWDSLFNTDAKGPFFLSQFVANEMIEEGHGGRIINFLSTAFVTAAPFFGGYAMAKAALWEATLVMSHELASHGITVNAVTPGSTMTQERIDTMFSGNISAMGDLMGVKLPENFMELASEFIASGQFVNLLQSMMPMGRPGWPDDLARAVFFLASDQAAYITGQNIVVDGGQSGTNGMNSMNIESLFGSASSENDATTGEAPTADAGAVAAEAANDVPAAPAAASVAEGVSEAASAPSVDASGEPDQGLAGTYTAKASTPMGEQEVKIDMKVDGSKLSGTMTFMGRNLTIENGVVAGSTFSYDVHIKVAFRKMDAHVEGHREGDGIVGTINNPMGAFEFSGQRV